LRQKVIKQACIIEDSAEKYAHAYADRRV